MENNILIFKTNICTEEDLTVVDNLLGGSKDILEWNVDTDDKDFVLRVVSPTLETHNLIEQITSLGYTCIELE